MAMSVSPEYEPVLAYPTPPGYSDVNTTLARWLTLEEARAEIAKLHGGRAPAIVTLRKACNEYRRRLEGRANDGEPVRPEVGSEEERTPRAKELRCYWKPWPMRRMYLVDPAEANLTHFDLQWPDNPQRQRGLKGHAGRHVGSGALPPEQHRRRPSASRTPPHVGGRNLTEHYASKEQGASRRSAPRAPRGPQGASPTSEE